MSNKTQTKKLLLRFPHSCPECNRPMPGLRVLVDTEDGVAAMCDVGHVVEGVS